VLRELFERPTVGDLCQHIEQLKTSGEGTAAAPAMVAVSREARRVKRASLDEN
jgi:hypothetical protein